MQYRARGTSQVQGEAVRNSKANGVNLGTFDRSRMKRDVKSQVRSETVRVKQIQPEPLKAVEDEVCLTIVCTLGIDDGFSSAMRKL